MADPPAPVPPPPDPPPHPHVGENQHNATQWYVTAPSPATSVSAGAGGGVAGFMVTTAKDIFMNADEKFVVQATGLVQLDTNASLTMRVKQATTLSCMQ